jgi:predicted dinucleotide-binding enzyme
LKGAALSLLPFFPFEVENTTSNGDTVEAHALINDGIKEYNIRSIDAGSLSDSRILKRFNGCDNMATDR